MIHEPKVESLVEKIGGSRYALCVVVSKRARQLMELAQNRGETEDQKAISLASIEVMEGKLLIAND